MWTNIRMMENRPSSLLATAGSVQVLRSQRGASLGRCPGCWRSKSGEPFLHTPLLDCIRAAGKQEEKLLGREYWGSSWEQSMRNGDGRSPPHCPSTCAARTSVGCKENLLSQRLCFQSGVAWRFCPVKMWNFVSFCTREKQPV